jgi:hypothetical protein
VKNKLKSKGFEKGVRILRIARHDMAPVLPLPLVEGPDKAGKRSRSLMAIFSRFAPSPRGRLPDRGSI